jgi:hypothetical protein
MSVRNLLSSLLQLSPLLAPPPRAATVLCTALAAVCTATVARAQFVTYDTRNGGDLVQCGPLGGPFVHHTFLSPVSTSESIGVSDPGGTVAASAATAQFDVTATQAGLTFAFHGAASRTGPQSSVWAVADTRDTWEFTITTPMRFTFDASLTASSTEATVPPCHFTFLAFGGGAAIVPDAGSPAAPYQGTLTAPGSMGIVASGTMLAGRYLVTIFGRAEGAAFPFSGSYAASLALAMQPAATLTTRTAFGNPSSYSAGLPVLGQTWNAIVDVGLTGHTFALVFASLAPAHVPVAPGLTVLLGAPVAEFLPITAGPQAAYALALPADPTLAGARIHTQAVHFGGAPTVLVTNALDLTLGF